MKSEAKAFNARIILTSGRASCFCTLLGATQDVWLPKMHMGTPDCRKLKSLDLTGHGITVLEPLGCIVGVIDGAEVGTTVGSNDGSCEIVGRLEGCCVGPKVGL